MWRERKTEFPLRHRLFFRRASAYTCLARFTLPPQIIRALFYSINLLQCQAFARRLVRSLRTPSAVLRVLSRARTRPVPLLLPRLQIHRLLPRHSHMRILHNNHRRLAPQARSSTSFLQQLVTARICASRSKQHSSGSSRFGTFARYVAEACLCLV